MLILGVFLRSSKLGNLSLCLVNYKVFASKPMAVHVELVYVSLCFVVKVKIELLISWNPILLNIVCTALASVMVLVFRTQAYAFHMGFSPLQQFLIVPSYTGKHLFLTSMCLGLVSGSRHFVVLRSLKKGLFTDAMLKWS